MEGLDAAGRSSRVKGRVFEPTHLYYMITTECNQRCSKCSHWKHQDSEQRLSPNRLVTAVRSSTTAQELCVVGGEPLLFKDDLLTVLRGCSTDVLRIVIITNGVLLDSEFARAISPFNVHVVVSIDTVDRTFWTFVRGVDSFERVLANVDGALEVLSPSQLSVQSVRAVETEPYLGEVAAWALSRGLYHSVQDYMSEGFGGSWQGVDQTVGVPDDLYTSAFCQAAGRNLSITSNGDVFTCFQQTWMPGCEQPLGNLIEDELEEILAAGYTADVQNRMSRCELPCKVLKCNQ
jgi:MoaA/NifB/PqqE/SkfB family radical SAM enzyme